MIGPRRRARARPAAGVGIAAITGLTLFSAAGLDRPACAADAANHPGDAAKPAQEFNAGTSAYRAGRFPQAAQAFERSIKRAPSSDAQRLREQQDAYYNLGNTLYRTGEKSEHTDPQGTIKLWTDAVRAYDTALQLRNDDPDSKFNRDLVQRKIDELRQRQNPPPSGGGAPPDPKPRPRHGQPPAAQGANPPPPGGRVPPAPSGGSPPPLPAGVPGQMSPEEAAELLDSAKDEERPPQAALAPNARTAGAPPEKPYKNW